MALLYQKSKPQTKKTTEFGGFIREIIMKKKSLGFH